MVFCQKKQRMQGHCILITAYDFGPDSWLVPEETFQMQTTTTWSRNKTYAPLFSNYEWNVFSCKSCFQLFVTLSFRYPPHAFSLFQRNISACKKARPPPPFPLKHLCCLAFPHTFPFFLSFSFRCKSILGSFYAGCLDFVPFFKVFR